MSPIKSSVKTSRAAYLILSIVNATIALWMALSFYSARMATSRTILLTGIFFFGLIGLGYFSAFIISVVRPRLKAHSPGEIMPSLERIRLFFRSLMGRMAMSCLAITLLTILLMGFHAFGYVEVYLYENVGQLSGWRRSASSERDREVVFARSPALLVTIGTAEPSPVQYLEGSLRIARELKPLGIRAFVVDTRPLTWTERERQLLAELDSVGTVYWASETPIPESRGGLVTRTEVGRGSLGALPRITPLSAVSRVSLPSPDILMKLTYNGRPNLQPITRGDGYVDADGIRIPVMDDGSVILRDPYSGFYNMELWTDYDKSTAQIGWRTFWSRYYFSTSSEALDSLYGIKYVKNKVALLAWFPQDYKYFLEWWDYSSALRAIQMQSFVQLIPWLFWPMIFVSLTAVYLLCVSFRPFLAMQLGFVVALIVVAAGTYQYTLELYIFNGTYVLFAILVAAFVLPFQAARDEAKTMAEENDGNTM